MRDYRNAARWIRSASPRLDGTRWARRALDVALVAAIVVLGAIGLVSPSSFGDIGAAPVRVGWPWFALLGAVVACAVGIGVRWRRLGGLVLNARRAVGHEEVVAGASDSLAVAGPIFQTRFALAWVWGPVLLLVVALTFAFATAYFAIDALLARFQVRWESATLAIGNVLVAFALFRLGAFRGSRLAISHRVHREAGSR